MRLGEIWRYPVKSMAGERLESCFLEAGGVPGDRLVHVEDAEANVITARTRPRLLGLHAVLGPDGEPLVDGLSWRDARVAARVREAAGPGAHLTAWSGPERFDVLPLLVATDGAIARFGRDGRRLRPNLVIEGVDGLAERAWEGRRLQVGGAVVRLVSLRRRCVMTTFDPDTLAQDHEVLRAIVRDFGGRLALDTEVERTGPIRVGDPVQLVG
jgi:uncharacterized protein YcbX